MDYALVGLAVAFVGVVFGYPHLLLSERSEISEQFFGTWAMRMRREPWRKHVSFGMSGLFVLFSLGEAVMAEATAGRAAWTVFAVGGALAALLVWRVARQTDQLD